MLFDAAGYTTAVTRALGLPQQQLTTTERDQNTHLIVSQTDAAGRKTAYSYDAMGNQLSQTRLPIVPTR